MLVQEHLIKINTILDAKIKLKIMWCNKTYTIAYVKIKKKMNIYNP